MNRTSLFRRWFSLLLGFASFSLTGMATGAELRIVHIDVGQGDATLIVGPSKSLLFDGGMSGTGNILRTALQNQGLTSFDYFVAGHYHEDHIGGIDELIKGGMPLTTTAFDRGGKYNSVSFTDYTKAVGSKRKTIQLGEQIDLGGGAVATCVAVNGATAQGSMRMTGENDRSIGLVVRFGDFDYYIASDLTGGGDGTADMESLVAPGVGDVDAFHVSHHGSATSTNQTLVTTLAPEHAIISCGDGNSYNHPDQGVLNRLTASPTMDIIWQTERCNGGTSPLVKVGGNITFKTDGNAYTVTASSTGQSFSYQTDEGNTPSIEQVVINELAWMGSTASSYDEWIELYNPGTLAVNLDGWVIRDDNGAQIYALSGSIAAEGYYLIERARTATSMQEDLVMSSLSLANTGDSLVLLDANGTVVDGVNLLGGAWWDGDNNSDETMERVDPLGDGNDPLNWLTHSGTVRNGVDSGGNPINGTPRALNAAAQ